MVTDFLEWQFLRLVDWAGDTSLVPLTGAFKEQVDFSSEE